ncbi:hypothetical protein SAMN05660703_0896 [Cellulophaga tyrosinoxydans]|uniref:Uncharacterized protein n=1 Tax=Cellulophaga tyrosinoxydans TaxID=504486 RepID=A0A1W1YUD6_9FLAO|nr:hypothetical protein SAMN05660703_0896 [Cellulophaga tyrosinoxydans]
MGIVLLFLMPAIILIIIGIILMNSNNKKIAKILFIIAGIYLVVGLGTCGYLFFNFSLEH